MLSILASDPSATPMADTFLQYGVLGAVALAGGLFAWGTIKRERQRADSLEARLNALQDSVRTEVVPAMTRTTDALIRLADYLPELSAKRRS